jgi:polar amino acid transport system substrate-binding protein
MVFCMSKKKILALFALSAISFFGTMEAAKAETVIEKVSRTGVLTAGTRKDIVPFAYVDDRNEWSGYSIDIIDAIRQELQNNLGKEIKLELVEVGLDDRIPALRSGDIDILCDATTFTWERDQQVDFTIPYFQAGTRLLVKNDSSINGSPESIAGKRIGFFAGTISNQAIAVAQPKAILVEFKSKEEAINALEQGTIDAFALDGVLLEAARRSSPKGDMFKVVPPYPQRPFDRQNYACMVPENNSKFLDYSNLAIARLMMGVISDDPRFTVVVDRWFGPKGLFPIDRQLFIDYFREAIDTREQIKLD